MATITSSELRTFVSYVHELCGIQLDDSKAYLLESRLTPLLQELQCRTYNDLYAKARHDTSRCIPNKIVDAISTRETLFFRDTSPFELLKFKLVPDHFERLAAPGAAARSLQIWSAACSTGQEVYSIAISLKELLGDLTKYRVKLLGTDIADAAIAQASYGRYSKIEVERGLSPEHLRRYFTTDGAGWRIQDELRAVASFRKLNLLEPLRGIGPFDIIFCRNVAIYFSQQDRARLFDRLADLLTPHGTLIIGATETLMGLHHRFVRQQYRQAVYYQLNSPAGTSLC
jgi:chemotaxis protein methyltransferase CheR